MRFLSAMLSVVLLALPARAVAPAFWVSPAIVVNPVANTVLADSGTLDPNAFGYPSPCALGGQYQVHANISATVAGFFKIIILDAVSAPVLTVFFGLSGQGTQTFWPDFTFRVPNGGKVQVQNHTAITGSAQVALGWSFWSCY